MKNTNQEMPRFLTESIEVTRGEAAADLARWAGEAADRLLTTPLVPPSADVLMKESDAQAFRKAEGLENVPNDNATAALYAAELAKRSIARQRR